VARIFGSQLAELIAAILRRATSWSRRKFRS
jgi:hypothetical protein